MTLPAGASKLPQLIRPEVATTYECNVATSPLLRLPTELRLYIYEHILGGETLHIRFKAFNSVEDLRQTYNSFGSMLSVSSLMGRRTKLTHYICNAKSSESEIYERFLAQDWQDHKSAHCMMGFRHEGCMTLNKHIELSLLRVCRQIYQEAKLIPYTSNAFSFGVNWAFQEFVPSLGLAQRHAITTIHLRIVINGINARDAQAIHNWDLGGIPVHHTLPLTSLRALHVHIYQRNWFHPHYQDKSWKDMRVLENRLAGLFAFRRLSLELVTVVVTDEGSDFLTQREAADWRAEQWSSEERKEWAESIRKRLLEQKGEPAVTITN